jgi:hypothetical protein
VEPDAILVGGNGTRPEFAGGDELVKMVEPSGGGFADAGSPRAWSQLPASELVGELVSKPSRLLDANCTEFQPARVASVEVV